jgi:hypothetical protein
VRAHAALVNKVRQRRVEEWKREGLHRTPFAILDEPPELRPVKSRGQVTTQMTPSLGRGGRRPRAATESGLTIVNTRSCLEAKSRDCECVLVHKTTYIKKLGLDLRRFAASAPLEILRMVG